MDAREFATRAGVSEATVSRLASGHRRPGLELTAKIRDLLDWPVDQQVDSILAGEFAEQFKERLGRGQQLKVGQPQ